MVARIYGGAVRVLSAGPGTGVKSQDKRFVRVGSGREYLEAHCVRHVDSLIDRQKVDVPLLFSVPGRKIQFKPELRKILA